MSDELRGLLMDPFTEWLMSEIEYCAQKLYEDNLPPSNYIDVKSRHDALLEVRDKYCDEIRTPKLKEKKIINE